MATNKKRKKPAGSGDAHNYEQKSNAALWQRIDWVIGV